MYQGNHDLARQYVETSLEISRQQAAIWITLWSTVVLGYIQIQLGNVQTAREIFTSVYRDFRERTVTSGIVNAAEGMAILALKAGEAEKAGQLLAWAGLVRLEIDDLPTSLEQAYFEAQWAEIRSALDPARLEAARTTGQKLSLDEATALAFGSAAA
jgi:hypothetical protein